MQKRGRTVTVLGGGVGGVVAANRLRKLLPTRDRVVLVSRDAMHVFQPSLLWVAVGTRAPQAIQRPIALLRRKGIDVITAEVQRIDAANRQVATTQGDIAADAVIISLGADLAPETIPGLGAAGHNLYSVSGATAIRDALRALRHGRVVVLTAAPAYKCPAAPYEAAMLIADHFHRHGARSDVVIDMYAAEAGPMGVAGPSVSAAVRSLVLSRGIGYFPDHQVTSVDASSKRLTFSNGVTSEYDVLVYVPPHCPPRVVHESGLSTENGWIAVDRASFETAAPMVFAIGDVTAVPLAMGKPLPKAGVFAHAQAEVVAHNLARAWRGTGARRHFDGHGQCFLEVGNGRGGLGAGNFYAEPTPAIRLHRPARWWHWAKILFEHVWFSRWL